VTIHRDAAPVVDHGDRVVDVDGDVDLIAMPGQRLVYRVVDDFIDEVVETRRSGRADIHRGPLADGFKTLENLDLVRAVIVHTRTVPVAGSDGSGLGQRRVVWSGVEFSRPLIVVRWFEL
jgi:hypothetical protein